MIYYEDLLGVSSHACEDKVIEVKKLLAKLMGEYHVVENMEDNESFIVSLGNGDDYLSDIINAYASRRLGAMRFKTEINGYLD